MSVKRRDLVRYLEGNGFTLLREGKNHSIYSDDNKTIPKIPYKVLLKGKTAYRTAPIRP